jgi:hypothetical protein
METEQLVELGVLEQEYLVVQVVQQQVRRVFFMEVVVQVVVMDKVEEVLKAES